MSRKEGNPKPQYADVPPEKKTAAYSKTYYENNKEKRRADGKIQAAEYRKKYPERTREQHRNQWIKKNFKKSPEWYKETLAEQREHCALCEKAPVKGRRFQIDHDHKCCPTDKTHRETCGKCVRGLLCEGCNTKLGHLEQFIDDSETVLKAYPGTWLEKALVYLSKWKEIHRKTQETHGKN